MSRPGVLNCWKDFFMSEYGIFTGLWTMLFAIQKYAHSLPSIRFCTAIVFLCRQTDMFLSLTWHTGSLLINLNVQVL